MSEPIYICDKCGKFETAEHNALEDCRNPERGQTMDDSVAADLLQRVADTLRGMSLDPRIPADARDVLRKQADDLQALLDSATR